MMLAKIAFAATFLFGFSTAAQQGRSIAVLFPGVEGVTCSAAEQRTLKSISEMTSLKGGAGHHVLDDTLWVLPEKAEGNGPPEHANAGGNGKDLGPIFEFSDLEAYATNLCTESEIGCVDCGAAKVIATGGQDRRNLRKTEAEAMLPTAGNRKLIWQPHGTCPFNECDYLCWNGAYQWCYCCMCCY